MAVDDLIFSPGTSTDVITGASTRASGAFSTEINAISSNLDMRGDAVLSCSFSTAPSASDEVHLYRRDLNISGANDATIPAAGYEHIYLGSFFVAAVTIQQYISLPGIPLKEGDQEFYIENDADQTMDSDYVVSITPMSVNQRA